MKTLIATALVAAALAAPAAAQSFVGVDRTVASRTSILHFDLDQGRPVGDTPRLEIGSGALQPAQAPVSMRDILSAITRHNATVASDADRIIIRDTAFGREAFTRSPNGLSDEARRAIAIQNATAADASERIYIAN